VRPRLVAPTRRTKNSAGLPIGVNSEILRPMGLAGVPRLLGLQGARNGQGRTVSSGGPLLRSSCVFEPLGGKSSTRTATTFGSRAIWLVDGDVEKQCEGDFRACALFSELQASWRIDRDVALASQRAASHRSGLAPYSTADGPGRTGSMGFQLVFRSLDRSPYRNDRFKNGSFFAQGALICAGRL